MGVSEQERASDARSCYFNGLEADASTVFGIAEIVELVNYAGILDGDDSHAALGAVDRHANRPRSDHLQGTGPPPRIPVVMPGEHLPHSEFPQQSKITPAPFGRNVEVLIGFIG